jgi:Alr-MurF fusion protein
MLNRLVWAEICSTYYAHNVRSVKKLIGPRVKLMAVVKANAYGHGAVGIAKFAQKLPVNYLGVVCLYEARELRNNGINLPILILNYIDPEAACVASDLDVTVNCMSLDVLKALDSHARKLGKRAKIHVKIDSGMHRAGLMPDQALKFIPKIEKYKNIILEGIFPHFATSDESDLSFTRQQNLIFQNLVTKLKNTGINPPIFHAANSGATLRLPEAYYDMVRPGICLYGLSPTGGAPAGEFKFPFKLKPVLELKTKIIQIRTIRKGESVGYSRKFIAAGKTVVGLLPVGYADGFRRAPGRWEYVLVRDQKAPVLGRISMDQTSVGLTGIEDVAVGDEVVLIGSQGNETISADLVAKWLGTINYEVVSSLASRVSRVYI